MCASGKTWLRPGAALWSLAAIVLLSAPASAQETADFFRQNCTSCHTIGGGRLTGPDLKNVTQRKDREWLMQFITNPKAVIDSGDPYATQLFQEARGVVMPTTFGLSRDRVDALLKLIEAESKLERSQFAGMQMSDRPFTAEDAVQGEKIFLGYRPLANGGPACASCHSVQGLSGLGGGQLGPDLTKVYERLEGRKALAAWLMAPATSTMQPVFKPQPLQAEEILPLVAYLEAAARREPEPPSAAPLTFFLLGLGGTVVMLSGFDWAWRRRFRAVRRPLVQAQALRGGR